MTKTEFAFKLLTFFMPYPLSRKLPGLLRRLLVGPSAETPEKWAAPALEVLSHVTDDIVSYSKELINSLDQLVLSDLQVESVSSLENAIDTAESSVAVMAPIVENLDDFTPNEIIDAFDDVIAAVDALPEPVDDLVAELPPDIIPEPPTYTPPVPPLYVGPSPPWLSGPSIQLPSVQPVIPPWVQHHDDSDWEQIYWHFTWDGSAWVKDASGGPSADIRINSSATWQEGFRPTKMRVTYSGQSDCKFTLTALSAAYYLDPDTTLASGAEIDLAAVDSDIRTFSITINPLENDVYVTNIEFYV